MKGLTTVVFVLALACTSCGEDAGPDAAEPGPLVSAPAQRTARLAVVHTEFGNPPRFDLVTTDADGARPEVLVHAPGEGIERIASPSWSPDAKRIYFVGTLREREGDRFRYYESDVFVVDAHGGSAQRVTDSEDIVDVAPAPDGQKLLVSRLDHPAERPLYAMSLWLVDIDGENATKVADSPEGALDFKAPGRPTERRSRLHGADTRSSLIATSTPSAETEAASGRWQSGRTIRRSRPTAARSRSSRTETKTAGTPRGPTRRITPTSSMSWMPRAGSRGG